jgi:RimJ/RimL family protein N-acetyltransferase
MPHPVLDLRGPRVLLRPWRESDLEPFAAMSADPEVMEFLPAVTRAESDGALGRVTRHIEEHGFAFWALELPGEIPFAGFVGLAVPRFEASFTPCVEVGWRLARAHWGKGYALEGANVALRAAFGPLALREVVAFTVERNTRSRRVMDRLGMQRTPDEDFDLPHLREGHPLRRHMLYRVTPDAWKRSYVT